MNAQSLTPHWCREQQQVLKDAFRRIEELETQVNVLKAEKESYNIEKCQELRRDVEIPEASSPDDEQEATGNAWVDVHYRLSSTSNILAAVWDINVIACVVEI